MKPTFAAPLAAILLTALAGCSVPTVAPSTIPMSSPSPSATSTVQQLCTSAVADKTLLGWIPATVTDFRSYQYSGPTPHVPLRDAFPGVDGSTAGAWCGIKKSADSIAWWAVVDGKAPALAITINGPGSGKYVGETTKNAMVVP